MTEAIAGAAIGSLVTLCFLIGWAAYLLRGHRVSVEGLRVVTTRAVPLDTRPFGSLPTDTEPPREPDFFDQARERGE